MKYRLSPLLILLMFFSLFLPVSRAAELSFGIDSKTLAVGDSFTVSVLLDPQESVNAVEGRLVFPGDLLEAKTISYKDASVINVWAQEPTLAVITKEATETAKKEVYSEIAFAGGITGGYDKAGKVFTVTFTAKADGQGTLKLASAKVLLNDGKGTVAKLKLTDGEFRVGTGLSYEEEKKMARYLLESIPNGIKNETRSASKCGFTKMDAVAAGWSISSAKKPSAYFNDINKAGSSLAWCSAAADEAFKRKVIEGRSKGVFGVKGTVSRYEVATIMARQLTQESGEKLDNTAKTPFIDDGEIPSWARGAVHYLNKNGIFKGFDLKNGTYKFGGTQDIINIDAAIVLRRTFKK